MKPVATAARETRACIKCGYDPDAEIVQTFSFLVSRDPPSLNQRLFNTGPRAHLYRKERDLWCWEFRAKRLALKIPAAIPITAREAGRWTAFFGTEVVARATNKRRVTLTRIYGGRQKERDRDNLIGGMKACVDALVLEGLIGGDDPHSAELHYEERAAAPDQATGLFITIEVLA